MIKLFYRRIYFLLINVTGLLSMWWQIQILCYRRKKCSHQSINAFVSLEDITILMRFLFQAETRRIAGHVASGNGSGTNFFILFTLFAYTKKVLSSKTIGSC